MCDEMTVTAPYASLGDLKSGGCVSGVYTRALVWRTQAVHFCTLRYTLVADLYSPWREVDGCLVVADVDPGLGLVGVGVVLVAHEHVLVVVRELDVDRGLLVLDVRGNDPLYAW